MTDMSEPAKIRHALDATAGVMKVAILLNAMSAILYLWRRGASELVMVCMWSAIFILALIVYRVRERKLRALDPD